MDDLTSLRAIRRTTQGPTDSALTTARYVLEQRMAARAHGSRLTAVLARVLDRLRHPSPLFVTFGTIAAVAVVGIVLLSVFGIGVRSVGQPAGPVPTATATPTPAPAVGSQQLFDGDCSKLFSDGRVSAALGSSVKLQPAHTVANDGFDALAVIMRGGVNCTWSTAGVAGSGDDPTFLSAVVLPTTATVKDPYCYGTNDAPACSYGYVASGLWISGVAYGPTGSSTKDLIAAIGQLEASFDSAAASVDSVRVVAPVGPWSTIDCATLDQRAHLATVNATPGLTADSGNQAAEQPPGYYTALAETHETSCLWQAARYPVPDGEVQGLDVSFQPGGAFARPDFEALPGAKEIAIAGTDGAVKYSVDGGIRYVVFSGSNVLLISGQASDAQLMASAAALVGALDSAD